MCNFSQAKKRSSKRRAVYQMHNLYQREQKEDKVAASHVPSLFARDGFHSRLDSPPSAVLEFDVSFWAAPRGDAARALHHDDDAESAHSEDEELAESADASSAAETSVLTLMSTSIASTADNCSERAAAPALGPFTDTHSTCTRPKRLYTRYNSARVENPRHCCDVSSCQSEARNFQSNHE